MKDKEKTALVNEIEMQNITIYNLRLYISAAIKAVPHLKKYLNDHFAGMPGYTDAKKPGKD